MLSQNIRRVLLLFLSCTMLLMVQAQKKIFKIEYFFDTDPGFENGTQIILPTPTQDISNINFTPSLTGLTAGLHQMFVRVQDSNYKWSQSIPKLFFKELLQGNAATQINKMEYFIDVDPGFGNGIDVPVAPSATLNAVVFAPNISALPTGLHQLFVRTKNTDGKWSQSNAQLFFREAINAATSYQVDKMEYFFDTDPGFGTATDVAITLAAALNSFVFSPDISLLPTGLHQLFVRTHNSNGKWSQSIPQIFYKENAAAATAFQVDKMEYFFDTDPGFGSATNVSITSAATISGFVFTPDISLLAGGLHQLFVRTKNNNGKWSQSIPQLFFKEVVNAATAYQINKMEYFIDADPGFGSGTNVSITSATTINGFVFSPDISLLPVGLHQLFVRTRNNNGKWSLSIPQLFYKEGSPATAPGNLVKMEYFFDTDPGFGSATDVPVTAATTINGLVFAPSTSGLNGGLHYLFVRTKDVNGKWSLSIPQMFYREVDLSRTKPDLVKLEYFIDTDPGFGNATNVPVLANDSLLGQNFVPTLTGLKLGLHWLGVRTRDANGKWSITTPQMFFYEPVRIKPKAQITRAEYYFDDFKPVGQATPVVLAADDTITGLKFPVNITGLSTDAHRFFLRTRNDSGYWSLTAYAGITITSTAAGPSIIVNSFTPNFACPGTPVDLAFDATGTYNSGNVFTAQLSDPAGSFASPVNVGSVTATTNSVIPLTIPTNLSGGVNSYKLRVVSSNTVVTGAASDSSLGIIANPNLAGDTTIFFACFNDTYNLDALYNSSSGGVWNTGNTTTAPPGQYAFYITAGNGCKDTANVALVLEVATWNGSVSNDWHNTANWSTNKVPQPYTHVIIPNATANPCVVSSADATCASMQVRTGANLQTLNNRKIMINGKCATLPPN